MGPFKAIMWESLGQTLALHDGIMAKEDDPTGLSDAKLFPHGFPRLEQLYTLLNKFILHQVKQTGHVFHYHQI